MSVYQDFLTRKRRVIAPLGIRVDGLPSALFPWQAAIVRWALRKGRAAIFADCGLGKTIMQLAWAQALGVRTLMLAPLCVAEQTVAEGARIGVTPRYARNQVEAIGASLVVANYERLDDFDLSEFEAVVLDESSILKAFDGKTRTRLIEACKDVRYRLCCTATPSPNDIAELANHAEFLGLMTRPEFLASWFVKVDQGLRTTDHHGWRLKGHAREPFYRWLASWAVALRSPADIGFPDAAFRLPELSITDHVIPSIGASGDMLFPELSTKGLKGRLEARRGSLDARVHETARVIAQSSCDTQDCQWLLWCGLNDESDRLTDVIPGAVNVRGSDTYAEKVGAVQAFVRGDVRVLISKAKILGFGMNFQHAHHMAFVGLGDSYEAYYQCIRRAWRFGQKHQVSAHVIVSEAEQAIVENVRRKEAAAASLAEGLIAHMRDFEREELAS